MNIPKSFILRSGYSAHWPTKQSTISEVQSALGCSRYLPMCDRNIEWSIWEIEASFILFRKLKTSCCQFWNNFQKPSACNMNKNDWWCCFSYFRWVCKLVDDKQLPFLRFGIGNKICCSYWNIMYNIVIYIYVDIWMNGSIWYFYGWNTGTCVMDLIENSNFRFVKLPMVPLSAFVICDFQVSESIFSNVVQFTLQSHVIPHIINYKW